MLHNTAAVNALKKGCKRLQLPDNTATELIHFLQVKRVHDEFLPTTVRTRNMSPGAALDKLWHFMLLNTDVSSKVHELVGGVVRHIGTDEDDLDDDSKRLQRLYALNIMAREGWHPDVRLWAEPGTNMSLIFPAIQSNGVPLYLCSGLTPAETAALEADLAHVYSSSRSTSDSNNGRAAEATAAAAGDMSDLGADKAGTCGTAQDAAPEPPFMSILNVADGRIFDLQLPEELAATGVAAADVKMAMADKLGQPASQLHLAVMNYASPNLGLRALKDTDVVREGDLVRVLLSSAKLPRLPTTPYQIVVGTLLGKSIDLAGKIAPWMLIYELKLILEAQEGYPASQQRIIYTGKQLEDSLSLKYCNLVHQSRVHLAFRLRGC